MREVRHALTRRRLMRLGLVLGGGALLVGSGAAYVVWPRRAAPGHLLLSPLEISLVDALADTWFPAGNAFGVAAKDLEIARGVDGYLAGLPEKQSRLIRALLVAIDQWPRLSLTSSSSFTDLDRDTRVQVLRAFEGSTVKERGQIAGLLRLLVAIPFFDDERIRSSPDMQWGCPVIP